MCFSENMSLIIGLSGLASGVYFSQKNSYAAIGIAYFSLMEIIQYFQYKVIDQCNNKWNKIEGYVPPKFCPGFSWRNETIPENVKGSSKFVNEMIKNGDGDITIKKD